MAELKCFMGTLTLSDNNMNRMDYGVVDLIDGEFHSITDELERIHNSSLNLVRVAVRIFNSNHVINRMGALRIGLDKYGVKSWFINSYPLDQELDELSINGSVDIEIFIEDFIVTSVSEVEAYVS
ncbi:MAG TPA: hypothetical protein VIM42_00665 [Clostridium sp.]